MTALQDPTPTKAVTPPKVKRPPSRAYEVAMGIFYPLLAVAIALGIWELILVTTHPASFTLPSIGDVASSLKALAWTNPFGDNNMWSELWSTLEATVIAFGLGSVVGIALGILMGQFTVVRRVIMPYLVALQSLPKAALVPVIVAWIGYGIWSKISIGFILAIFAVIVNTLQGVTAVDQNQVHLVRSLGAGRWTELRYVRWPAALPSVFVGLELAIVYSLLGIVVAEVLGAQAGIGVEITQLESVSDTKAIFALLIVLAVVGFVLHGIVAYGHRRFAWWDRPATPRRRSRESDRQNSPSAGLPVA